jgi:hypothetical protein
MPASLECQEWSSYKPSLRSQVINLGRAKAASLLSGLCVSLTDAKDSGLTCKTRPFSDLAGNEFHPKGVIFGHFLDSAVEAAAISGSSYEGHAEHFGGTLLLTQEEGKWNPIWYKAGLITRSCEKAQRPDGRDLLICEFEDAGMGHRYHTLYSIDLRGPSHAESRLVWADTFESDFCTAQRQTMQAIRWGIGRRSFFVSVETPHWEMLPSGTCDPPPPKRPPRSVSVEFEITDAGIRPHAHL